MLTNTYHATIARSPCKVFLALTLAGVPVTRVGYDRSDEITIASCGQHNNIV